MNIDVAKLKKAIDRALDAHRQAYEAKVHQNQEWDARRLDTWRSRYHDAWAAAVDRITEKLQHERPVLASDLPRVQPHDPYRTHDFAIYPLDPSRRPGDPDRLGPFRPDEELVMLRNALELVTDATVTPRHLASLGITGAKIRHALMHIERPESE